MRKYSICVLGELNVNSPKAIKELWNFSKWQEWSPVIVKPSLLNKNIAFDFGINTPVKYPIFNYNSCINSQKNEMRFEAVMISKRVLCIEWVVKVQKDNKLVVQTIHFSGKMGKTYYEIFGPLLIHKLREMNKKFFEYSSKAIGDSLIFKKNFRQDFNLFMN